MSIIIKMQNKPKGNPQKKAYTYIACVMVFMLLISVVVPLMSGGGKAKKSNTDYKQKAYDLARLPFDEEADEQEVLGKEEYKDIAEGDRLINGIYTEKEKEQRQETDKLEGIPMPPDADYKEAAAVKAVQKQREERRAEPSSGRAGATSKGSLRAGNTVTGGATGGGSAYTWRKDDRNPSGSRTGGSGASASQIKQDMIEKLKGGRTTGFFDAVTKSSKGANAQDSESAASGSIDAFQKGGGVDDPSKLNTDLEKDATAGLSLNQEELDKMRATNDDLDKKLDDALQKDKQNKDYNPCPTIIKSSKCFWNFVAQAAVNVITKELGSAVSKIGSDDGSSNKSGGDN